MRVCAAAMVLALFAAGAAEAKDERLDVSFMVGGDPSIDACDIHAEVRGLDPEGDDFLAVRAGPGTSHRQISALYEHNIVIVCAREAYWVAVLYPEEGYPDQDCGVSTPIATARVYDGPCEYGWAHSGWIHPIDE